MKGIQVIAVGQFATFAFVFWIAVAPTNSGHPGETLSVSSFSELEASIEGLEDRIASLDGRLKSWGERLGEPMQNENRDKRVRARPITLGDLKNSIEKLRVSVVPATFSRRKSLHTIRKQNPRINWAAIETLRNKNTTNSEKARKSVQLLTPAEVLQRFGSPSKMTSHGGNIYWLYRRQRNPQDLENDDTDSFLMTFTSGQVVGFR